MASIKKRGSSYPVTVSCGRDSQYKKITKTATFRPDPYTARGNPKPERAIQGEVAAFAADFDHGVKAGQILDDVRLTFKEYAEKYLKEYAEPFQAPRTLETTRAATKIFTRDFGHMTLKALSPLFLREYVNAMARIPRQGKPGTLSASTVRRRMAVLSAMLSQAVRWNLVASNPMDRVQIRKSREAPAAEKPMCFNQEQAEAFLRALENPLTYRYGARSRADSSGKVYQIQGYQADRQVCSQLKLFFYLAMFTGCRRGELLALTWSDIDFNNSAISITKSCCRVGGEMVTKSTKTKGSARMMAVPAPVLTMSRQ